MEDSSIKGANRKDLTDLTDDIWYEIFLRLPLDSIFNSKCVSKLWFSLLSSPYFTNKWYKLHKSLLPWTFVHDVYFMEDINQQMRRVLQYEYPDLHSQIISDHQYGFSFSFLYQVMDANMYLLGSSNGLVLCTTGDGKDYYVCNPLTQKWVLLPPPPKSRVVVYGFMCDECFLEPKSFKVIRIPVFGNVVKECKVEIFSSDLGKWNVYDLSFPALGTWKFFFNDHCVTHNGVFYWYQNRKNIILAVSVNGNTNHGTCGNECRLLDIPDLAMDVDINCLSQCLGESEGLLCFARFNQKERSLSVWVLDGDWHMLHKDIKLHDWLAEVESQLFNGRGSEVESQLFNECESDEEEWLEEIQVVSFSPVDKNVVILRFDRDVWAYDTRNRVYEQLCHPSSLHSNFASARHLNTSAFVLKPRPTMLPPVSSE